MRISLYSFAISAALSLGSFAGDLPTDGLGIRITNCVYDVLGVDIDFATTNPPPYVAAVFVASEAGFNSRICPIRMKVIDTKHACFAGDFTTRANTFVQVLMPSATNDPMFRVMTQSERDAHFDWLRESIDFDIEVADTSYCWTDNFHAEEMQLVRDRTWACFRPGDETNVTLQAQVSKRVPDVPDLEDGQLLVSDTNISPNIVGTNRHVWAVYDGPSRLAISNNLSYVVGGWEGRHFNDLVRLRVWNDLPPPGHYSERFAYIDYNPHYPGEIGFYGFKKTGTSLEEQTLGPFDTTVGLGLRIYLEEPAMRLRAERAYSLFSDRSNECLLQRPFKALSAHNGKKYKIDWRGFVRITTETNAIPDKIYLEGL